MIVTEKEARESMHCCQDIQFGCRGSKCMGWRKELVEDTSWSKSHSDTSWTPAPVKIPLIETGRGYCGLIYK